MRNQVTVELLLYCSFIGFFNYLQNTSYKSEFEDLIPSVNRARNCRHVIFKQLRENKQTETRHEFSTHLPHTQR